MDLATTYMGVEQKKLLQERYLVVGLGATGLSCARFLTSRGHQVAVADSREKPPGLDQLRAELPDVALFLGEFDPAVFRETEIMVLSPGVPQDLPAIRGAVEAGVELIGDIDLFAREVAAPVIAITGSNAKSTVTTLIGLIASAAGMRTAVGGNLGEPALNLLNADIELYVLELSSFQLETCNLLQPAIATVLNISPDHMDRYPDLGSYIAAKARILNNAGTAVYNRDDPRVMAMPQLEEARYFTLDESSDPKVYGRCMKGGNEYLCRGKQPLLDVRDMQIQGTHNQANALAALAISDLMGFDTGAVIAALRGFRGLPHRSEFVAEIDQVRWYNDSKGTNPGATIAALKGLHQQDRSRTILIAGGDCKHADFADWHDVLGKCARAVILIGRDRDQIRTVIPESVDAFEADEMSDAVTQAAAHAMPGDRVLLSPGCASFDMYQGFAERGDDFVRCVRERLE